MQASILTNLSLTLLKNIDFINYRIIRLFLTWYHFAMIASSRIDCNFLTSKIILIILNIEDYFKNITIITNGANSQDEKNI